MVRLNKNNDNMNYNEITDISWKNNTFLLSLKPIPKYLNAKNGKNNENYKIQALPV